MEILLNLRKSLQQNLSQEQKNKFKKFQRLKLRWIEYFIYKIFFGSNLKALAILYNTDKWGSHWYAQHYQHFFCKYRHQKINILEIGIGGYDVPEDGGGSLRMWKAYFPKAQVYGIDIYDKSPHNDNRIKTFKGSQIDEEFLTEVINSIGSIDIIIDDGSHQNDHVIKTFSFLFPHLKDGGMYVIEDTQTSYWKSFGGSSDDLNGSDTMIGFFKSLIDSLNHAEFERKDYEPNYYDQHIVGMHFFHNMIFLEKNINDEESNCKKK